MPRSPNASEESIGERIRRLRSERSLSQREIAGQGISYAYISRIEGGKRTPSVKAIRMLARKLGVSPEYLETGVDLAPRDDLELRLSEAELRLRLGEETESAEQTLHAVLDEADQAADRDLVARTRVAIGLHAARAGRHEEAIGYLGEALGSELVSPLVHPRVYTGLADCYRFVGRPAQAATVLARALEETREHAPGDQAAQIRFATKLSEALSDLGELEQARELLEEAAEGWRAPDPYSRIRLLWSLARLAAIEGKPRQALPLIRHAITLLETTEDSLQLARAHLLSAEIMLFSSRADEAGPHIEAATRLFELGADQRDLGAVRAQQALYAARRGDTHTAITTAQESLKLLAEDPTDQATAWLALAVANADSGEIDEADSAFQRAVDQLAQGGLAREAAQAAREWSSMLRGAGRTKEALDAAERATELALHARAARAKGSSAS